MIPVPWPYWKGTITGRKIIRVDPIGLRSLAKNPKGNQLLSGWGKRMCRMSLGALFMSHVKEIYIRADEDLAEINPKWLDTEHITSPALSLQRFRAELNLD